MQPPPAFMPVDQGPEPADNPVPRVEVKAALVFEDYCQLMGKYLNDQGVLVRKVVIELAFPVPEATRMSSTVVAATPRSYINEAAAEMIPALLRRPRRVIGSGIVSAWLPSSPRVPATCHHVPNVLATTSTTSAALA